MWDACRMPWVPELFSAPALEQIQEKWHQELVAVPFFDGLIAGEFDALARSFAGVPELHHPVRGRIRGAGPFETFVVELRAWIDRRNVSVTAVDHVVTERQGFEEVVLHFDGEAGRVALPAAIVADRPGGRINELRVYFSSWANSGRHLNRPPILQRDPQLREAEVVADYQSALSTGDVGAIVAQFEPDGYVREPAGDAYVHAGPDGLRAFYERMFSNGGGVALEQCGLIDDQRAHALEYNVVRWGRTELPPQAGLTVYVRGQGGKLAAARIYDDVDPPL